MRDIMLSSVGYSTFFPHIFMYGTILSGKFIEHKMRILIFSYKFASNISHFEKN